MIEMLASFQDITTVLASFAGIMAMSMLALDELMKRVDEYFSSYNEDEKQKGELR